MTPLHPVQPSSLLGGIPGLLDQFREVPREWWTEGAGGMIECPCGTSCLLLPRARFVGCVGCGRLFLLTKTQLLCAQGMTDEAWAEFQAEPLVP